MGLFRSRPRRLPPIRPMEKRMIKRFAKEAIRSNKTYLLFLYKAKLALDSLEVLVGCVIVENGSVIAAGRTRTYQPRK
ncbi:hypothetical protein NL676_008609 [Syzygium grande]|nr:hypothetical protein NL676_008609 [Syzygium grande]